MARVALHLESWDFTENVFSEIRTILEGGSQEKPWKIVSHNITLNHISLQKCQSGIAFTWLLALPIYLFASLSRCNIVLKCNWLIWRIDKIITCTTHDKAACINFIKIHSFLIGHNVTYSLFKKKEKVFFVSVLRTNSEFGKGERIIIEHANASNISPFCAKQEKCKRS